jgi:hypothetical protein
MNPGLVASYRGCNITTTASFVGTGTASMMLGGVEKDHVMIRVVPPGEKLPEGLEAPNYVALPKDGGRLAFLLKPGEAITLTGGTWLPSLDMFGAKYEYNTLPVFMANSIARSR